MLGARLTSSDLPRVKVDGTSLYWLSALEQRYWVLIDPPATGSPNPAFMPHDPTEAAGSQWV